MNPIPIGNRGYHVCVNAFNEKPKIHIRKYFKLQEQLIPTKQGVTLNEDEFAELQTRLPMLVKKVKKVKQQLKSVNLKRNFEKTKKEKRKISDETKDLSSNVKIKKEKKDKSEKIIEINSSDSDSDSSKNGSENSVDTTILSDYSDYN